MGAGLIGLVGVIYLYVGYTYLDVRRVGMMLTFIGYAIANVGLIIDRFEMEGGP
jgi:hypothetical protein